MFWKSSRRPVTSLWVYIWFVVSQTRLSLGLSNTRCSASVSSTTPRLEARCPPRSLMTEMMVSRASRATWATSSRDRDFRSAGWSTRSSILPSIGPSTRRRNMGGYRYRAKRAFLQPSLVLRTSGCQEAGRRRACFRLPWSPQHRCSREGGTANSVRFCDILCDS